MASLVSQFGADELTREALARVPGCEKGQPPQAVSALHGGTSNATFHVQTRLGSFVMRINEPESSILGVDRRRETVLHGTAARAGLAPAIVHADDGGRFLITEYVVGATWVAHCLGDPSALKRLAKTLRLLHALNAPATSTERETPASAHTSSRPVAHYDLSALLQQHARLAREANPEETARLDALLERAEAGLQAMTSRRPVIIHNDLFHANVIDSARRLYLVDWEYAAVADPLFDLGCLLAYYPEAQPHAARLLEETGLASRASREELAEITWIYVLLSYLWYRTRGRLAPPSESDRQAERALYLRLQAR